MRPRLPLLAAALVAAAGAPGPAVRADDLDLIPGVLLDAPAPLPAMGDATATDAAGRAWTAFTDATVTSTAFRPSTAPGARADWSVRLRAGGRGQWALGETVTATADGQLAWTRTEGRAPGVGTDVRLDVKEAFVGWAPTPTVFLDLGRINIKTGVATGFNPTDVFAAGAVVDRATEDASALRDERLGTVAMRAQTLWDGGGATVALSPRIDGRDDAWWSDAAAHGLHLDATNPRHRALLTVRQEVAPGVAPEAVVVLDEDRPLVGGSVSLAATDRLLLHAEAAMVRRPTLRGEALEGGGGPSGWHLLSALGGSLTVGDHVTVTLEHHYNGAGLDGGDREALAAAPAPEAWRLRALARDRQEPLARHTVWSRVQWQEALGDPDLTLSGLAIVDAGDGSALVQGEGVYALSGAATATLRAATSIGADDSQFGALPAERTLTARLRWSF